MRRLQTRQQNWQVFAKPGTTQRADTAPPPEEGFQGVIVLGKALANSEFASQHLLSPRWLLREQGRHFNLGMLDNQFLL